MASVLFRVASAFETFARAQHARVAGRGSLRPFSERASSSYASRGQQLYIALMQERSIVLSCEMMIGIGKHVAILCSLKRSLGHLQGRAKVRSHLDKPLYILNAPFKYGALCDNSSVRLLSPFGL
jgi:hypothetical protein